ncbi:MAG: ATP-dependent sacrificial sulfur transferase LarE [Caldisphaera sp.]|uniref:ATP-dependent sacrificial sulfur transferase LarE n=1 Tax=Caldisphaera sp. TaxID=2060322 RepID=UPI003D09BF67
MNEILYNKLSQLKTLIKEREKIAIAFSGGVDSTFLLKIAKDTLTNNNVVAVTAKNMLMPENEFIESKKLAELIGVRQIVIETDEAIMGNENIKNNKHDRCYHCKKINFSKIKEVSRNLGYKYVADGSNLDDTKEYRPGFKALYENGIISPLIDAHLTKIEIREISKELKLPTWDKPSFSCLATRFPYNTNLTKESLIRVEKAENYIKKFDVNQLRIRSHNNDIAIIEVTENDFNKILDNKKDIVNKLREIGYKYIALDIEGYYSGKINRQLEIKNEY